MQTYQSNTPTDQKLSWHI